MTESVVAGQQSPELLVVCLCAQWCGVCAEYRARFDAVYGAITTQWPNARFLWVDVEDQADILYPLDVEDFPTLLIASGDSPCFFGPLTPQAQTLERMVRTIAQEPAEHHLADDELRAAVSRLRGL